MNIQWFPGHMAKTRRLIDENLKLVDVVIELLDARIPSSSENPEIQMLVSNKPRIVALNKSDLADPAVLKQWEAYYKSEDIRVVLIDALKGTGIKNVKTEILSLMKEKHDKLKEKGRIHKSVRTMVVGIPNVGKSSFINRLAGKAVTQTGDRPGVTRGKQWIKIDKEVELLDTPGILWPKFDDEKVGFHLAVTGAIKDDIMDIEELALHLIKKLSSDYPEALRDRFKLQSDLNQSTPLEIFEEAGKNRGCIISKGQIDYHRIAAILLDEFRGAKIGKISLEKPNE